MFAKLFIALVILVSGAGISFSQDIFEAARAGNLKQLKELAKSNPESVKSVNSHGFTPLMIACYRDQTKAAQLLVDLGADVNASSPEGSALQAAVYKSNTKLAVFLLQKGASINAKGPDGNTALMLAVLNQNEKMVKMLFEKGADLKLTNNDGQSAYSLAMTQANKKIQSLTKF